MNEPFKGIRRAFVALSGGADSACALGLAVSALGPGNVIAVTATNSHIFRYQVDQAQAVASRFGVTWEGVHVPEMPSLDGRSHDRCYTCKRAVMTHLSGLARKGGFDAVIDGTNADDDPAERPGMAALAELGVRSPLRDAGIGEATVRRMIKDMVPGMDFVSESCLATRIEDGVATAEEMQRIEQAEDALRKRFPGIRVKRRFGGVRVQFRLPVDVDPDGEKLIRTVVEDVFGSVDTSIEKPDIRTE